MLEGSAGRSRARGGGLAHEVGPVPATSPVPWNDAARQDPPGTEAASSDAYREALAELAREHRSALAEVLREHGRQFVATGSRHLALADRLLDSDTDLAALFAAVTTTPASLEESSTGFRIRIRLATRDSARLSETGGIIEITVPSPPVFSDDELNRAPYGALSERQVGICLWVAQGWSQREIAERLGVGRDDVRELWERAYARFGVDGYVGFLVNYGLRFRKEADRRGIPRKGDEECGP